MSTGCHQIKEHVYAGEFYLLYLPRYSARRPSGGEFHCQIGTEKYSRHSSLHCSLLPTKMFPLSSLVSTFRIALLKPEDIQAGMTTVCSLQAGGTHQCKQLAGNAILLFIVSHMIRLSVLP